MECKKHPTRNKYVTKLKRDICIGCSNVLIADDINPRTGKERESLQSSAMNCKIVNEEGKKLIERLQKEDLLILNGANEEDADGEYTEMRIGCTVIEVR